MIFKTKTKLFIDFDGTLFDTTCFREKIFKVFLELGFDQQTVEKGYKDECQDYLYSPQEQAKRLKKIKEYDIDSALDGLRSIELNASECIYPNSAKFLENIDRKKYEVILLTLGDIKFQKAKYSNSGLNKYFDNAIFTTIQKWDYLIDFVRNDEKFILIDDRGNTCKNISEKFPNATAIEINRKTIAPDLLEPKDEFGGIKIINLMQAEKYL
jgi:hypothetical protein